jgi:hypothetical protein
MKHDRVGILGAVTIVVAQESHRSVRLAYQPPASRSFLSEQTSHQQPASSTFLSEQISTSHQPPAKRTGCTCGFRHPALHADNLDIFCLKEKTHHQNGKHRHIVRADPMRMHTGPQSPAKVCIFV